MSRTPELVRIERSPQSVSIQVTRALISAGVAESSRNVIEAINYFDSAAEELGRLRDHLANQLNVSG